MTLHIIVQEQGETAILELRGSLTLTEGYAALRDRVKGLLGGSQKRILLDFAQVTEIDSGGLGTLIELLLLTRKQNAQLKLASLRPQVKKAFDLTRLASFFAIYASEEEALADFK